MWLTWHYFQIRYIGFGNTLANLIMSCVHSTALILFSLSWDIKLFFQRGDIVYYVDIKLVTQLNKI